MSRAIIRKLKNLMTKQQNYYVEGVQAIMRNTNDENIKKLFQSTKGKHVVIFTADSE